MDRRPNLIPIVAAALIDADGRVLVQKRPEGKPLAGLWEFPGGKIEADESPEAALVRELEEELGIQVAMRDLTPLTFATEAQGDRTLVLLLYLVRTWTGTPMAHIAEALRWCPPDALGALPMPPADAPFVTRLTEIL